MATRKSAALVALLATACSPTTEHLYPAHPSDVEGLEPFPEDRAAGAAAPENPPAGEAGAPRSDRLPAPTGAEGRAAGVAMELVRGTVDGDFGPLGHVADEAAVSLESWYGSESLLLEVVTAPETGDRALFVVRHSAALFQAGPTAGKQTLPYFGASVWLCGEGADEETGADWTWDQPATVGTVEILEAAPGLFEYRFEVQSTTEEARTGRASARASIVVARDDG